MVQPSPQLILELFVTLKRNPVPFSYQWLPNLHIFPIPKQSLIYF